MPPISRRMIASATASLALLLGTIAFAAPSLAASYASGVALIA